MKWQQQFYELNHKYKMKMKKYKIHFLTNIVLYFEPKENMKNIKAPIQQKS